MDRAAARRKRCRPLGAELAALRTADGPCGAITGRAESAFRVPLRLVRKSAAAEPSTRWSACCATAQRRNLAQVRSQSACDQHPTATAPACQQLPRSSSRPRPGHSIRGSSLTQLTAPVRHTHTTTVGRIGRTAAARTISGRAKRARPAALSLKRSSAQALRCRIVPFLDQGAAAARRRWPGSCAGLSLGRPARRKPGHTDNARRSRWLTRHADRFCAQPPCWLPIVQHAATVAAVRAGRGDVRV